MQLLYYLIGLNGTMFLNLMFTITCVKRSRALGRCLMLLVFVLDMEHAMGLIFVLVMQDILGQTVDAMEKFTMGIV